DLWRSFRVWGLGLRCGTTFPFHGQVPLVFKCCQKGPRSVRPRLRVYDGIFSSTCVIPAARRLGVEA
ncbi:MAG: hypothetical protein WCD63_08920, partial [Terrimicrobiaceae bacterium]